MTTIQPDGGAEPKSCGIATTIMRKIMTPRVSPTMSQPPISSLHGWLNETIAPDYVKHALAPWEYPCGFLFVYDPGTYPAAALDVLRQCVDLYKSWQCCRGFWILIHENPRQSHSWKSEEFRKTLAQIRELDEILAPSGGLDEPTLRTESYKEACLQVGLALLDDARPFVPESVASAKFSDDDWRRGNWPSTWSHVNYLRAAWETLMNCKYRLGIDLPEIAAEFEARLLRSREQYCSFPITRQHR
jgi:hypothetical protein